VTEDHSRYVDEYLRFTLKKQGDNALSQIEYLADSKKFSLIEILDILVAAQQQVGSLWAKGSITVADEHYTTDITLKAIDILQNKFRPFHRVYVGSALLANFVDGEFHTVSLKMFAGLLKVDGWNVDLFVAPLHVASLFKHIGRSLKKFNLICCSLTMEFNLEELASILKILRTNINTAGSVIIVGSQLFSEQRYIDKMTDQETGRPLADFFAKDFEDGLEFIRNNKKLQDAKRDSSKDDSF
jgi:methanogenic corrinoid protein MtbC1